MSLLIYQAISNGYDKPTPPKGLSARVDYQLILGQVNPENGALWNRYHKIAAPPDWCDQSLYLDGNIGLNAPPIAIEAMINGALGNADIAMMKHPERKCAYVEIEACLGRGKITDKEARIAHAKLTEIGLPKNYGLWACGVIARRSRAEWLSDLQHEWFELCKLVCRDQLWLTAALYKLRNRIPASRVATIDMNIWKNPYFTYARHKA